MQIPTRSRRYSAHANMQTKTPCWTQDRSRTQGNPAAASVPHDRSCHVCTAPLFSLLMLALITVCRLPPDPRGEDKKNDQDTAAMLPLDANENWKVQRCQSGEYQSRAWLSWSARPLMPLMPLPLPFTYWYCPCSSPCENKPSSQQLIALCRSNSTSRRGVSTSSIHVRPFAASSTGNTSRAYSSMERLPSQSSRAASGQSGSISGPK